MSRSSARLKNSGVKNSSVNSRSPGKKYGYTEEAVSKDVKVSHRAAQKVDASFRDTSALQNESMLTRSGKKVGGVKCPSLEPSSAKKQHDGKHTTIEKNACDLRKTFAKSKDQKERTRVDIHCSDSNNSSLQSISTNQSSTKSKKGKGSTEKTSSLEKKNDHYTTLFKGAERDPNKTPTVLHDWVIKPVPHCHGICVEGQIEGREDFWHSTAIAEALDPKLLVTATGSLYKLEGRINKLLAFDYGISKDVAKAFANGFPSTWKNIIKDYYEIMEQSITVTQECMSPKRFQALKTKRCSVLDKTIVEPVDIHKILTPTGLLKKEMNRSELTTTRSGRMSLPPLAGWAGQYYVKAPGENSVQVTFATDTAKQALGKETMHALAVSKRDQLMLCRNALSKSLHASSNTTSPKLSPSKKNYSQSEIPKGASSHKKISQHFPGMAFPCEKENALGISFQPQVVLEDCDSHAYYTRWKGKPGTENSSGKRLSSTFSDKCEDVTDKALDKEEKRQSKKRKTNMPSFSSISKAKRQKKFSDEIVRNDKEQGELSRDLSTFTNDQSKLLHNSEVRQGQALEKGGSSCLSESPQSPKPKTKKSAVASRKRKIEAVDQTGKDSDSGPKDKKTKLQGKPKKQKLDLKNKADEDTWTQPEKDKFHRALRDISNDKADLWSLVSLQVGTKSAHDCQLFHKEFLEKKTNGMKKPAAKKPTKTKKGIGREKGGPIRGGKGTLKRKQDIREFLNEQNEGYEDDLFKGTPFVKMKHNPLSMPDVNIDFNKEDSEIFGNNHNFFTPVAGKNPFETPGLKFKAMLASVKKTPSNQTASALKATPETVDTRKHDICIKHVMDQKKKAIPSKVLLPPEDLETSILPIKSLFPGTPKIFVDNIIDEEQEDEDDDDENDGNQFLYYFSDGE